MAVIPSPYRSFTRCLSDHLLSKGIGKKKDSGQTLWKEWGLNQKAHSEAEGRRWRRGWTTGQVRGPGKNVPSESVPPPWTRSELVTTLPNHWRTLGKGPPPLAAFDVLVSKGRCGLMVSRGSDSNYPVLQRHHRRALVGGKASPSIDPHMSPRSFWGSWNFLYEVPLSRE